MDSGGGFFIEEEEERKEERVIVETPGSVFFLLNLRLINSKIKLNWIRCCLTNQNSGTEFSELSYVAELSTAGSNINHRFKV